MISKGHKLMKQGHLPREINFALNLKELKKINYYFSPFSCFVSQKFDRRRHPQCFLSVEWIETLIAEELMVDGVDDDFLLICDLIACYQRVIQSFHCQELEVVRLFNKEEDTLWVYF